MFRLFSVGSQLGQFLLLLLIAMLMGVGCTTTAPVLYTPEMDNVPRELQKMSHAPYMVEPPDILQIDLVAAVPKSPFKIRALDVLNVNATGVLPTSPITGPYVVEPSGDLNLGPEYGVVAVSGKTLEECRKAVEALLKKVVNAPVVAVSLVQTRATQQIRGPHLVRPDGTIGLGSYGQVSVVGLTIVEIRQAIEKHLMDYYSEVEVSVDVIGYNSKVFYVVYDYGGAGQQVLMLPTTGNETILDGIGRTPGLPTVADQRTIWIARPRPNGTTPAILPVDWKAIVQGGDTRTNYQILPGDRIFVKAYDLVATDNRLARIIAPIERLFGVVLLGTSTVNSIRYPQNNSGVR